MIARYRFGAGVPVRCLPHPRLTYYDWRARAASPSARQLADAEPLDQIRAVRASREFAATYGSPRV